MQQLINQHLDDAKFGFKTRKNYRSQAEKHIIPCIGRQTARCGRSRHRFLLLGAATVP
ncbi:hypothetical protein [Kribbella steppae]|uniref:hypothetical protein n=1 Tax=Kribbella steppae TaxID=2512223 RepID=UPI00130E30AF|nr:hypothetical protein [Kribbella steppae]